MAAKVAPFCGMSVEKKSPAQAYRAALRLRFAPSKITNEGLARSP